MFFTKSKHKLHTDSIDTVKAVESISKYDPNINSLNMVSEHCEIYETDQDEYFEEAARLVIDNKKASIGIIQRYLKLGFNRAARIMDQLEEAGIVGAAEGTMPRKVLMTSEYFEQYKNSIIISPQKKAGAPSMPSFDFMKTQDFEKEMVKDVLGIDTDFTKDGAVIDKLTNSLIYNCSESEQHDIIEKLIAENSSKTLTFFIYDEDGIQYAKYNGLTQLAVTVVTSSNKLTQTINWLFAELKSRLNTFSSVNVKNFKEYNKVKTSLPAIAFVVSEVYLSKSYFDSDILLRIALNGNRAGIYLLFFSQFDAKKMHLGMLEELLTFQTPGQAYCAFFSNEDSNCLISKPMYLEKIDNMNGKQFESFCSSVLANNGFYNVETTKDSGDHGIDILAEKDDITYAFQCKCYSSNIGNAAVQQAHTGKSLYHRDIAVVLTNQYFTQQAQEEAKSLGVKLWDRNKLEEMINRY